MFYCYYFPNYIICNKEQILEKCVKKYFKDTNDFNDIPDHLKKFDIFEYKSNFVD